MFCSWLKPICCVGAVVCCLGWGGLGGDWPVVVNLGEVDTFEEAQPPELPRDLQLDQGLYLPGVDPLSIEAGEWTAAEPAPEQVNVQADDRAECDSSELEEGAEGASCPPEPEANEPA